MREIRRFFLVLKRRGDRCKICIVPSSPLTARRFKFRSVALFPRLLPLARSLPIKRKRSWEAEAEAEAEEARREGGTKKRQLRRRRSAHLKTPISPIELLLLSFLVLG